MDWGNFLVGIIETAIYSLVGIVLMGLCFLIVRIFTPFSIKKEIEDDQNISLGIIIGAIILGISIIVASVISSPSTLATKTERTDTKSVSETQK
jgi:putative membrane protein